MYIKQWETIVQKDAGDQSQKAGSNEHAVKSSKPIKNDEIDLRKRLNNNSEQGNLTGNRWSLVPGSMV